MPAPLLLRIVATLLLSVLPLAGSDADVMVVHRQGAQGWVLEWRGKSYRCAVGRNGVAPVGAKREGDGRTPAGTFPLRGLYFRPDKVDRSRLPAALRLVALEETDGWCDQPDDPRYNRPVKLPYPGRHEELWRRNDDLYDLIVPLGYNDEPVVPGLGSAIFLHVARPGYGPTAGCVALSKEDLLEVLQGIGAESRLRVVPVLP